MQMINGCRHPHYGRSYVCARVSSASSVPATLPSAGGVVTRDIDPLDQLIRGAPGRLSGPVGLPAVGTVIGSPGPGRIGHHRIIGADSMHHTGTANLGVMW